jgi:uncharacterized membrane protein YtjA (UPF0391 family)
MSVLSNPCAQTTTTTWSKDKRKVRNFYYKGYKGGTMLRWAVIFFVIALIAAAFGFLGIAAAAVSVARVLFYIFLILFLVSLVGGLLRRTA